jgi:hypothetical protein
MVHDFRPLKNKVLKEVHQYYNSQTEIKTVGPSNLSSKNLKQNTILSVQMT